MNINLTLIGQFMALWVPVMTALSIYLGFKKTETPMVTGFLGFLVSLVPPFSLVYLAVLALKPNVSERAEDSRAGVA